MCPGGAHASPMPQKALSEDSKDKGPPDWEAVELPPAHILSHLTDAHCHPTDLDLSSSDFDGVKLGGMCAMATDPWNQDKVKLLGKDRPWSADFGSPCASSSLSRPQAPDQSAGEEGGHPSVKIISSFGYHPWFTHLYTISANPPSKEDHYTSIFFKPGSSPTSKNRLLLNTLLPYLPEPLPFPTLLDSLRRDIQTSKARGTHTLLGEVGLDGGARVRWPVKARHLYTEKYGTAMGEEEILDDQGEWKRLTPFKVSMEHQKEILRLQMEIAVELGVCASVHSVAAAGPMMDVLIALRDKHRTSFTNRINVDIHSGGGWSPEFWKQAELSNLYASPSIFITGRSAHADDLIAAISPDRMLVESDSHDARLSTRLVWAAALWIGRVKGWELEGVSTPFFDGAPPAEGHDKVHKGEREESWEFRKDESNEEACDDRGKPVPEGRRWTVRTLERNMARFLRTID